MSGGCSGRCGVSSVARSPEHPRHPGHPPLVSLRSLAPPYAEAKGACWWLSAWVVWLCRVAAPRPPRAYPACLLRSHAPLSSGTKGAGWIPAFAGMTVGGAGRTVGVDSGDVEIGGAPPRPGHTPRACFARTRPFRRGRKGQWIPAYAGMTREVQE